MKKMGIDALIRAMDVISYIYAHVYLCKTSVFMTTLYFRKKTRPIQVKSKVNPKLARSVKLLSQFQQINRPTNQWTRSPRELLRAAKTK